MTVDNEIGELAAQAERLAKQLTVEAEQVPTKQRWEAAIATQRASRYLWDAQAWRNADRAAQLRSENADLLRQVVEGPEQLDDPDS